MDQRTRDLVIFCLIGLLAGWLASVVVGGSGLVRYLVSGVIGAFVGPLLLDLLRVNISIGNALATRIITATIGAIAVVVVARLIG